MQADFVACVADHGAFFGEGFEGVAWDEPGCFDVVFFEEFEETGCAMVASPEAWVGVGSVYLLGCGIVGLGG